MRRDHAPIVAVELRRTDDPRTDELRERFEKAQREQAERDARREAQESFVETRSEARRRADVILFGGVAK